MTIEATLAVVAACVTTLVTVVLFVVNARWNANQASEAAKARMVSQMMQTMSEATNTLQLQPWMRIGKTPEFDFTLAVPRLLVDVPKSDEAIFLWALGQTQLMREASTNKGSLTLGIQMTARIAEWHRGYRSIEWFKEQLKTNPVPTRAIPTWSRLKRITSQTAELALSGVLVGIGALGIGYAIKSDVKQNRGARRLSKRRVNR